MSKKRKQRARARQVRKARQGTSRATRKRSGKGGLDPQTRRWFTYLFWIGIALILVGGVAVTFYYTVWRPSIERLQAPPPEEEESMHLPAEIEWRDDIMSQGEDNGSDTAVARGPADDAQAGRKLWRDPAHAKG